MGSKNILFDFITLQDSFINGGNEYTYKILEGLLNEKDVKIFALINENIFIPERTKKIINEYKIDVVSFDDNLQNYIIDYQIESFFIGIAQRYNKYNLTSLKCKIFIVCHDIGDLSQLYDNNIYSKKRNSFVKENSKQRVSLKRNIKIFFETYVRKTDFYKAYRNFGELISKDNVFLITDSNYSKYALIYFFSNIKNPISVFYCPHKQLPGLMSETAANSTLNMILEKRIKYFLILNASRQNKNAALFIEQWNRFCNVTDGKFYAIILDKINIKYRNVFQIDSLSSNDLEIAYKNAFALVYPSVTEGFGYPPLEAMKYGTPAVCSNVTSIPEITGLNDLLFSPYYPEDLFMKLLKVVHDRNSYSLQAVERYNCIRVKQENDYQLLLKFIKS